MENYSFSQTFEFFHLSFRKNLIRNINNALKKNTKPAIG